MEASKLDISGISESKLHPKRKDELRRKAVIDYLKDHQGIQMSYADWNRILHFKTDSNSGQYIRRLERKHIILGNFIDENSPKKGKVYSLPGAVKTINRPEVKLRVSALTLEEIEKQAALFGWGHPEPALDSKTINTHADLRNFLSFLKQQYA